MYCFQSLSNSSSLMYGMQAVTNRKCWKQLARHQLWKEFMLQIEDPSSEMGKRESKLGVCSQANTDRQYTAALLGSLRSHKNKIPIKTFIIQVSSYILKSTILPPLHQLRQPLITNHLYPRTFCSWFYFVSSPFSGSTLLWILSIPFPYQPTPPPIPAQHINISILIPFHMS